MPRGVLFWVLYLIALVLVIVGAWPFPAERRYWSIGGVLLLFALLALLGWDAYGPVLQ